MKYDFDYLMNLYQEDPDRFDEAITSMKEDFINSLPEAKREIYRAKQWRIERELEKIKNPLERMNRMVSIFWDGVNDGLSKYRHLGFLPEYQKVEASTTEKIPKKIDKIVKFDPNNQNID
jgi:hypothetical protein